MSIVDPVKGLETEADDIYRDISFKESNALADQMVPKTGMIKITWGEIGTNGVGSLNSFYVSGKSWPTNYWAPTGNNQYLIDSAGSIFKILSNTADTLTVVGTPSSGSYIISPAAYSYAVKLQYLDENGVLVTGSDVFYEVVSDQANVPPRYRIGGLVFGRTYRVSIASKNSPNKNSRSEFCETRDITVGCTGYDPLIMSTISLQETDYGVLVEWTKVDHSKGYELVWTTDGSPPDFNSIDQNMARTYSLMHPIVADVDELVRVAVRCYDRSGRVSSNVEEDSLTSGAQGRRSKANVLSGIIVNKDNTHNTKNLRTVTKFSLPEKVKVTKIQFYANVLTNGPQKIRVFVDGQESLAVHLEVSASGYAEQVVNLEVLSESVIAIDCWDTTWDSSPPGSYPTIYGQLTIRYEETTGTPVFA